MLVNAKYRLGAMPAEGVIGCPGFAGRPSIGAQQMRPPEKQKATRPNDGLLFSFVPGEARDCGRALYPFCFSKVFMKSTRLSTPLSGVGL